MLLTFEFRVLIFSLPSWRLFSMIKIANKKREAIEKSVNYRDYRTGRVLLGGIPHGKRI
jgi:hypothetical protein